MGQVLYERPREKLRSHGVRFLTLTELIQLILGSGSAQHSSAKLARKVHGLIVRQKLVYDELVALGGVGDAKACQLLAAFEFGRRIEADQQLDIKQKAEITQIFLKTVRHYDTGSVICCWLDGSGSEIDRKAYMPLKDEHYSLVTKRIFADALVAGARSVIVVIVTKNASRIPNTYELGVISTLRETATLLGVRLAGIYASYKTINKEWSNVI